MILEPSANSWWLFPFNRMMEEKNKVIISEGNRPIWQLMIAAVHYTAIVSLLFLSFKEFEFTDETKKLKRSLNLLEIAILLLPSALYFSVVKDVLFDLGNEKYKIQYCVGPVKVGRWRKLPRIEYVSVFKQLKTDGNYTYEVNLWYKGNRHFNLYDYEDTHAAFAMGGAIARTLDTKLLDATTSNNYKWVKDEDFISE